MKDPVEYAVRVLGITEADIKDWQYRWDADLIRIRTWNHRKFIVTGLELFTGTIDLRFTNDKDSWNRSRKNYWFS